MGKAVLISIRPKWCDLIALGKKTIEVRRTRPKLKTPFKCYIYQTLPKSGDWNDKGGRVIGEFFCNSILEYRYPSCYSEHEASGFFKRYACISAEEIWKYGQRKTLYGWHISNLTIYDKPKELSEFWSWQPSVEWKDGYPMPTHLIKRPPQSFMYVEELADG